MADFGSLEARIKARIGESRLLQAAKRRARLYLSARRSPAGPASIRSSERMRSARSSRPIRKDGRSRNVKLRVADTPQLDSGANELGLAAPSCGACALVSTLLCHCGRPSVLLVACSAAVFKTRQARPLIASTQRKTSRYRQHTCNPPFTLFAARCINLKNVVYFIFMQVDVDCIELNNGTHTEGDMAKKAKKAKKKTGKKKKK